MRITAFFIDRFGIFADQQAPFLSPGLNIFLGRNEAGKSTCLRFFKSMLFGYKRGRSNLDPMHSGARSSAGGTLRLESRAFGPVSLTRRPGPHGGSPILTADGGKALSDADLHSLFGGMGADVYDAVFAFSLDELSAFASLSGENVRHALHGAAFGYVQSPASVLKILEGRMRELLKDDRGQAAVNLALRELEEVRAELKDRQPDLAVYALARDQAAALEADLEALQEERGLLLPRLRRARRRLDVWQDWRELGETRAALHALPEVADNALFDPEAAARLDALLARLEERRLALAETERARARLADENRDAAASLPAWDAAALLPEVRSLREEKERRLAESELLSGLTLDRQRLTGAQERALAFLGPAGKAAPPSLAERDDVRRRGRELLQRERALEEALSALARMEAEAAEASVEAENEPEGEADAAPGSGAQGPDRQTLALRRTQLAELERLTTALEAAEREAALLKRFGREARLSGNEANWRGRLAGNPLRLSGLQLALLGLSLALGGLAGSLPALLYSGAALLVCGLLLGLAAPREGRREQGPERGLERRPDAAAMDAMGLEGLAPGAPDSTIPDADALAHNVAERCRDLAQKRRELLAAASDWLPRSEAGADFAAGAALLDAWAGALSLAEAEEQERLRRESARRERDIARQRLLRRLDDMRAECAGAREALEAAQAAWRACLRALNLDEALGPDTAAEALELLTACAAREKELTELARRREVLLDGLAAFAGRVRALAGRADEKSSLNEITGPEDPRQGPEAAPAGDGTEKGREAQAAFAAALGLLERLSERVEQAARRAARAEQLAEQLAGKEEESARARAALDSTGEELRALLDAARCDSPEAFRAAFAAFRRRQALQERQETLLRGLDRAAGEEGLERGEFLASLEQSAHDDLRREEDELLGRAGELEARLTALSEDLGRARQRLDALAGEEGAGLLRQREALLTARLRELSRQWAVPALAREFLLRAKRRFEEEGHEGVIRFAGDIFASVTDGAYSGIAALEEGGFAAVHRSGERRDPHSQLSRGTREQLYLALRLAYVRNHAAKAESLPLILDDILVNFDPQRASAMAAVLAGFSARNQMLFFTCHPGQADMLAEAAQGADCPAPARFSLDQGRIAAV